MTIFTKIMHNNIYCISHQTVSVFWYDKGHDNFGTILILKSISSQIGLKMKVKSPPPPKKYMYIKI